MKVLLTCAKALKNKGCWSTMNQVVMIEATKAQFFKQAIGAMVDVDMNLMLI